MSDLKLKQESFQLNGSVHVQLIGPDGKVKQEHTNHNLIVTVGKTYLAAWIAAASQAGKFMEYMGLGTGTTSPVSGNTALETELSGGGYSRQNGTISSSLAVWQNVVSFAPGNGTAAITEAGLFSASTVGTMFARQTFSAYNKAAGDTLTITWTVTFS